MLHLKNINCENELKLLIDIISLISELNKYKTCYFHTGDITFESYMCGNGVSYMYNHAKLIYNSETLIGYVLTFLDEAEYDFGTLPEYEVFVDEIINLSEKLLYGIHKISIIPNGANEILCKALINHGYTKECEKRFHGILDLDKYKIQNPNLDFSISLFKEDDLEERVKYASIPMGFDISIEQYINYINSSGYKNSLDYVIRHEKTNNFIGFFTLWFDEKSKTVLLEPVACREEYRRQRIMKRALQFGFDKIKNTGMDCVFVSTGINNVASQALYTSVGFIKKDVGYLFSKELMNNNIDTMQTDI